MGLTARHPVVNVAVVAAILGVGLLVGCTPDHNQSTFDATGPVAKSQLILFYWIFGAAVFVFVLVEAALLYAVIRYRKKPGDTDPKQTHGHTRLEIAWTLAPAIVLAVVAIPTIGTIFDNANSPHPPEEGGMLVEVVASQWWWQFNYTHPDDPEKTLVTANELHIPVGTVVNLTLDSKDVLHSFWIPKIAGKVDVVPNNLNKMWIRGDETGNFFGQCAEFCGISHGNMRFNVVVESREDFDAWLRKEAGPGFVSTEPLAAQGKELFEGSAGCFACHTIAGSNRARGTRGPNLTHLASRKHLAAGIMENTQINLRRWLEDPDEVKPGNLMGRDAPVYTDPAKKLTEPEISALVAYLRSLK
jgi:cytochrome c oxidase subunit 2